jgi:BASS family bile acid:Na+ symporter
MYNLFIALLCLVITIGLLATGYRAATGPPLILCLITLSIGFRGHRFLSGFSFTILILAAVTASLFYPDPFRKVGDFNLQQLILPLLQLIMFGMGTSMSLQDFAGVVRMPKAVAIGLLCQYTIMPLLGFVIAKMSGFPPEIAAGVILIGVSPSGLASNVMSYLAKANVALSVTLTALATLMSPIVTPFLMKLLAGQFIPIQVGEMMWSIVKLVILPIVAGLLFNRFFHGKTPWLDRAMPLVSMSGIAIIITIITAAGRDSLLDIGLALVIAAVLQNVLGYFLGYWSCRLLKMPLRDCRTIAIEVGMQNAGLASGIALEMGKVATLGLAPAVFGPWMNISGSSLATWWREHGKGA